MLHCACDCLILSEGYNTVCGLPVIGQNANNTLRLVRNIVQLHLPVKPAFCT